MNLLVRLYPRAWRARYGDELEAILEDRPPGPFDVADLLLRAFDAHLHLRPLGSRSALGKELPMSRRLGGTAAVVGGALWFLSLMGAAIASLAAIEIGGAAQTGLLVSSLALLVALAGLSAFQSRRHPRLIWASFAVPAVGTRVAATGLVSMLFRGDAPLIGDMSGWIPMLIGVAATVAGSILFGAVTYRTGALSRRPAALLTASAVIQLAAFALMIYLPTTIIEGGALLIGTGAFAIGWIALGLDAIGRDRAAVVAGSTSA